VEVYSIRSDEESQESSVLEDFEDMFHDTTKKQATTTLQTQPPPPQPPQQRRRRPATPIPKVVHDNNSSTTPESFDMSSSSSIGHLAYSHEKKRPGVSVSLSSPTMTKTMTITARVSLSPPFKPATTSTSSKVSMLERVVTECLTTRDCDGDCFVLEEQVAEKSTEGCKTQDASVLTTMDGRPNEGEGKPSAKQKQATTTKENSESMKVNVATKGDAVVATNDESLKSLVTNNDAVKERTKQTTASKTFGQVSHTHTSSPPKKNKLDVKESPNSTKANKPHNKQVAAKVSELKSSRKKETSKSTKAHKDDTVSELTSSKNKDAAKKSPKSTKARKKDKQAPAKSLETQSLLKKQIAEDVTQLTKANTFNKVATTKGSETQSSTKKKDIAKESTKSAKASKVDNKSLTTAKNSPDTHGSSSSSKSSDEPASGVKKRKSNDTLQPPNKKNRTFQDQILFYMLTACKPFSLKSLAQSLQTTEASINYALMSLLDKGLVIKKEFASGKSGRAKELYWANQDSTAKQVLALLPNPLEIRATLEEYKALQKQDARIAMEMNALQQEPDNEALTALLVEMENAVLALQGRWKEVKDRVLAQQQATLKKNSAPPNCPRRMKLRINAMRDEWKKRKTKCMDFVDQLADGMEKKPKDVIKLLDLETDEMEKVTMPPKHVL
jgi:26S proteasome regulatory subunit (ATPase 3-interacting protein)